MSVVSDQMDRDIAKAKVERDRMKKALERLEDHAKDHREAIENQEKKIEKFKAHQEEALEKEAEEAKAKEDAE